MARRLIGLDIGTNAVTVTEVEPGDPPTLRAFGQVALPHDAMREGEVVDSAAVTTAVRRLWREVGLKKSSVRVGLATPRLVVRPVELPAMSDEDLVGALRFQAQELIPIPIDEAVLDFQVLEAGRDSEGQPTSRVLLAAAHRDTVSRLAGAVSEAGLRVEAVDLVPLALIRSLGRRVAANGEGAEAIVCIGAGVTVVVVHEAGLPRFARILGVGGRTLTEAIARDLDLAFDAAEALKRQGIAADDDLGARARAAIERPLSDLLEEVRGSLDFYRTQPDSPQILHVLLDGGGSQLPGIRDRLGQLVDLPIVHADARSHLAIGDIGFPSSEYELLDPYLAVPVGLALGGLVAGRSLNLLPSEARAALNRRRLLITAGAVGAALVLGLGYLTYSRAHDVSKEKDKLSAQTATNAKIQRQIDALRQFQATQTQLESTRAQTTALLENDVSWAQLLEDVAMKLPQNDWLTAFQGSVTTAAATGGASRGPAPATSSAAGTTTSAATTTSRAGAGSTSTPTTSAPVPQGITGTISFTAVGRDFPDVSEWIQRISDIPSMADLWVPTSVKAALEPGTDVVNFTSTATITPAAKAKRTELQAKLKGAQQ